MEGSDKAPVDSLRREWKQANSGRLSRGVLYNQDFIFRSEISIMQVKIQVLCFVSISFIEHRRWDILFLVI